MPRHQGRILRRRSPRTRGDPRRLAAALVLGVVAGCAVADPSPPAPCPDADGAFACVFGASLAAPPHACEFPLTRVDGVEARTRRAFELAGELWGASPEALLTGWTVAFCQGWFVCPTADGGAWTYGCALPASRLIRAAPGDTNCLEGVLIHEFGHLAVGDPAHRDPRFATATSMQAAPCAEVEPASATSLQDAGGSER
jgi:hypothetical protein